MCASDKAWMSLRDWRLKDSDDSFVIHTTYSIPASRLNQLLGSWAANGGFFVAISIENATDSMEPSAWGPHVWSAIHLICLGAPVQLSDAEQEQYQQFINYLALVIPCATCRQHLKENLRAVPVAKYLSGRDKLFEWSVRIHNLVNASLGKPEWNVDAALEHWEKVSRGELCEATRCKNKWWRGNGMWIAVIVVVAIGVGLYSIAAVRRRK